MKTVLEKEILVTEQQEKTNIAVPFSLPTAAKQVVVHFSYAPKKLEGEAAEQKAEDCLARDVPQEERVNYPDASAYTPLLNLITVSVDDPEGYRGCAHRQNPQQTHILSESQSSPGFLSRKCPAGDWRVMLHVHALVTGSCTCKLAVDYEEGGRMMRNWFACELHCHTLHSDGDFSVEELMRTARERLLDGINLTDHNTDSGVIETKAFSSPVVLPGVEWTTYFGHMLVLDCKQYVDWRDALPDTIDQKMRQVHENGGLCGVAHPFQLGTPICTGGHWDYHVQDWSLVNYIEIFSEGCPFLNSANRRAIALWQSLLDKGYHIAPTFGRDWHRTANNKLLSACTYLLCDGETLTPEKMKQALLSGRTCVSAGPLFYFETANGESVGDAVKSGATDLTFYTDTKRLEALKTGDKMDPETVRLLTNGGEVVLEMPWRGGKMPATVELLPGRYYRAELWGKINEKPGQLLAACAAVYTK